MISLLEKDLAAPVSSLGDMVRESGDNDPGSSCHAGRMPYLEDFVNCHRNYLISDSAWAIEESLGAH
ncbi:MAG: hypothetical protein N838_28130 [Thiohalocapsa sp. PB-PSB1]|nr:MAG: hypothetical protein N838_28130 [Thiohalocapsa sp. PB-PSB1]